MTGPVTAKNVDLSNCDREQIQFSGAILPHGFLLTLKEPELRILQVSQNAGLIFNVDASDLLGRNLADVMDRDQFDSICQKREGDPSTNAPTRVSIVRLNGTEWNVLAHRNDQVLFLEFEPRSIQTEQSVADLYSELRVAIASIQKAKSLQEFLDLTVERIRAFTGFDRVMAYKFLQDGSGWVRSEAVIRGHTPYVGYHFPPSDIPAPARRLFTLTWLRHQPDIHYTPVPLIPENNPLTGEPLDLSFSLLRSVSVMYTGYLKNMGTDSSMVLTLMKNGQLWGLIACHHHNGPKHVPYEIRAACEFLANFVSLLISEKEDLEFAEYKIKLQATKSAMVENMNQSGEFASALVNDTPNLLDFVEATGAAVVSDGKLMLLGKTPTEDEVWSLVRFLSSNFSDEVFANDSLAPIFPEAAKYKELASGLLAIRFSAKKQDYLLWFRPEVIQTVNWAGDPHKPVDYSNDGQRLLPRTSFALWREFVQLKSAPWLEIEIEAARELRIAIVEHILRQAEELGELYRNLERSHIELDAFAYVASHDLKEPLRAIRNYSKFLLEDCANKLRTEDVEKLRAMGRLTQRMEFLLDSLLQYSRISRVELQPASCDLNKILADALDSLSARLVESGAEIRVPAPLPTVQADASAMGEVFSNLISNALKYNDKSEKWVEIGVREPAGSTPILYVRDNGIGIEPEHQKEIFMIFRRLHGPTDFGGGTGAGLMIVRKILDRSHGRIWVESTPGQGTTFYFTIGSEDVRTGR